MEHFTTSEFRSLEIHSRDVKLRVGFTNRQAGRVGGGLRSDIREFSRQSRSRLLFKARNIEGLQTFITLTYPDACYSATATGGDYMTDGRAVKEHLRRVRQWLEYRGCYGFWFLEFQKRGAPHLHICSHGELTAGDQVRLKKYWHKLVGSSCPNHLEHGAKYEELRRKEAAAAYAAKYSAKEDQKRVPDNYQNCGRFWGLYGRIPNAVERRTTRNFAELYTVVRIARRWVKADARSKGYRLRKRHGGITGHSFYSAAPVLRAYLERLYILSGNPARMILEAPPLHRLECGRRAFADIAKDNVRPARL